MYIVSGAIHSCIPHGLKVSSLMVSNALHVSSVPMVMMIPRASVKRKPMAVRMSSTKANTENLEQRRRLVYIYIYYHPN